jgi:hypothetical protein
VRTYCLVSEGSGSDSDFYMTDSHVMHVLSSLSVNSFRILYLIILS